MNILVYEDILNECFIPSRSIKVDYYDLLNLEYSFKFFNF